MDAITWFVPPQALHDPRKNTRHRGIAKSLLTISLVVSLMYLGVFFVRNALAVGQHAMFVAGIVTPILGALLIRATGDISLGLVVTNIGGILIIAVWAFLTGGITSMALPGFLANIALLSTFGNTAILLVTGAILAAALLFLYVATTLHWLPLSMIPDTEMPGLMLTSMLGSVGIVVLAGFVVARDRAAVKTRLRTAQRDAEQSSRAKSIFLTSISNEFRTPLITILELAERLRTEPPNTLSKEQLAGIGHISAAGQHLLGLVTRVLDMSRIEAGELRLNMEPLHTGQLIAACLPLVEVAAEKKRISLVDDCGASADWVVWADLALIKQVLLNLLSNAVKFNREGGSVTLSCRRAGPAYLRISVADTGIGVASGWSNELFEPFSRLGAEAGNFEGTGLSLAISKQLIDRMRGRIGYDTTAGLGSTFWIELPLADTKALPG
jgi:signal transduction histidine kinase